MFFLIIYMVLVLVLQCRTVRTRTMGTGHGHPRLSNFEKANSNIPLVRSADEVYYIDSMN